MYFITTVHLNKEIKDSISTRCVGYYKDLEEAKKVVKNNKCDIFECLYEYAVIEKVEEGLYQLPKEEYWFKINDDFNGYKEIEKPNEFKGWAVFGIG